MVAVRDMFRWKKWHDQKLVAGLWLAAICCLLLLVGVRFTPNQILTFYLDCPGVNSSESSENLYSSSAVKQQHQQERGQDMLKVVEEWQLPSVQADRPHEELEDLVTFEQPRRYMPLGSAGFLFVQFGAYRSAPNSFAVVGLGPKVLHKEGNPGFECSWVSSGDNSTTVRGRTRKSSPERGLGRLYSVVIVHCMFGFEVGAGGSGGRLEVVANHGSSDQSGLLDAHWVALREEPKVYYDGSVFLAPYTYDYLYCGSPLFGSISPQRIREWIAYHVWLFGPRAHFILYDAGGLHSGARRVLQPWVERGSVTILNIRQQSRYDQYYYSQFLVINDCLFKSKTLANWTFFFDVDEYIFVPAPFTFHQVMLEYTRMGRRAQQVHFKQHFMSHFHCRNQSELDAGNLTRRWMIEKLVYRRTEQTTRWGFLNRKYAIQARYASSAGVHNAKDTSLPEGVGYKETVIFEEVKMTYNHFHHTVNRQDEICQKFVDPTLKKMKLQEPVGLDRPPGPPDYAWHVLDTGMADLVDAVREFEMQAVGEQPFLL